MSSARMRINQLHVVVQQTAENPQNNETVLVALHSYESTNPEDLAFNQGDKITLISKSEKPSLSTLCF